MSEGREGPGRVWEMSSCLLSPTGQEMTPTADYD